MKAKDIKEAFASTMEKIKVFLKTPQSIRKVCTILSLYTVIVFNIPTFGVVIDNIGFNWNGALLFFSVAILMFVLNWFIYCLLLWLGRAVGKGIISFTLIGNSIAL